MALRDGACFVTNQAFVYPPGSHIMHSFLQWRESPNLRRRLHPQEFGLAPVSGVTYIPHGTMGTGVFPHNETNGRTYKTRQMTIEPLSLSGRPWEV